MRLTPLHRGLLVGALHVALVASVGAKLLVDRETYPKAWMRTRPFDPETPLRGRYVQLRVEAQPAARGETGCLTDWSVRDGKVFVNRGKGNVWERCRTAAETGDGLILYDPVAFYIAEHVKDPSIRGTGEELWVEATLPPHGPPRPIRLGVKRNGTIQPLDLR